MWRPIAEHKFPWEPSRLVIIARHDDGEVASFICTCADGGNYYEDGCLMALDELGWTPLVWIEAPEGI